jgi:hypothetical protein
MRRFVLLSAVVGLVACGQEPTAPSRTDEVPRAADIIPLITNGELDGVAHPFVGLMVADDADGRPMWRCTGALISPTVFLTAGHCTDGAARATIWFESDVEAGIPGNGYPVGGPTSVEGIPHTHPQFDPGAFYLHDLGVVVLDEPLYPGEYGELPSLGVLDAIPASERQGAITAVGYGLQKINPVTVVGNRIRLFATLNIIDLHGTAGIPAGTSVLLSANARTGGTCFGDSGGPQFLTGTNVIASVTSFGLNGNCAGVGGGYRVDQADDLDWLSTFGS